MRLLLIHERLSLQGGAEHYLLNTADFLKDRFEVSVAFDEASGEPNPAFKSAFKEIFPLSFDSPENFQDIIKRQNPHLLYFHKCLSVPFLQVALDSGIPAVRMAHDHDVYCMRSYKYFPWSRKICTKQAGSCCVFPCLAPIRRSGRGIKWVSHSRHMRLRDLDQELSAHFVGSQFMREELVRQGYKAKKISIFPPLTEPLAHPLTPSFSDRNVILFVGQIVRGKGLDLLIHALSKLTVPFRLVIFGEGSHRLYCERLSAKLGIRDQVDFRGFVSREAMEFAFEEASLLAFPSVWPEPFGRSGLEAMDHGLPVVAFDSGGVKDWVKDGVSGCLVPWMDVHAFAQEIEVLLRDKERAKALGESAKRFAAEHFDFSRTHRAMVEKLVELAQTD